MILSLISNLERDKFEKFDDEKVLMHSWYNLRVYSIFQDIETIRRT